MGIFKDMLSSIFHHGTINAPHPADAGPTPGTSGGSTATATVTAAPVDVQATLERLASENKQTLDWRNSIVDLMKLVGMDSSLASRKELAADLHYTGDTNDTATMNIWLHKEVMKKLGENGGKIPPEMLAR